MATRVSGRQRAALLNPEGQMLLEKAFAERCRQRASFGDFAEGYIKALDQQGRLLPYLMEGVDPYEVLEWVADRGLPA